MNVFLVVLMCYAASPHVCQEVHIRTVVSSTAECSAKADSLGRTLVEEYNKQSQQQQKARFARAYCQREDTLLDHYTKTVTR